jgi:hypothetical protein
MLALNSSCAEREAPLLLLSHEEEGKMALMK